MQHFRLLGVVPPAIGENTPARGWAANLAAAQDLSLVRMVDVVGPHDLYFDATIDRVNGIVSVWNIAAPDHESFGTAPPELRFSLRAFMQDGSVAISDQEYRVAVTNQDDTPPSALGFASGGRVTPGDIGATIGRLSVTDRDSTGPFHFTISEADAWMYEVVNMELRLKPGMAVSISDGPARAILVEVSDGTQSAGFRLQFDVVAPNQERAVLDVLDPWERINGFSYKAPGHVWAERGGWEVASIQRYGDKLIQLNLRDNSNVWLSGVDRIELLNGTIDLRPNSTAFQVNAIFEAVLGRPADTNSLSVWVSHIDAGRTDATRLTTALIESAEFARSVPRMTFEYFVERIYLNSNEGVVDWDGWLFWVQQLYAGTTWTQVALNFVNWSVHRENMREENPLGFWLQRSFANEVSGIYQVALDRLPERGGFEFWLDSIAKGVSLRQMAQMFGRSDEFLGRFATKTTPEFVRELYLSALDREPDQAGFNFWVQNLNSGAMQRHDMVFAFAFSDEMGQNMGRLASVEPWI